MPLQISPFLVRNQPLTPTPAPQKPMWGPPDMSEQLQKGIAGIGQAFSKQYGESYNRAWYDKTGKYLEQAAQAGGLGQPGGVYGTQANPYAGNTGGVSQGQYDASKGLSPDLEAKIAAASQQSGLPVEYYRRVIGVESGGGTNPLIKNPNSGAMGLFQFLPSTGKQYGVTAANLGDVDNQFRAFNQFTLGNKAELAAVLGRDPTPGELYLAHQQGVGGATKLFRADPNAPVASVLGTNATSNLGGLAKTATVGEFVKHWSDRVGSAPGAAAAPQVAKVPGQPGVRTYVAPGATAAAGSGAQTSQPTPESIAAQPDRFWNPQTGRLEFKPPDTAATPAPATVPATAPAVVPPTAQGPQGRVQVASNDPGFVPQARRADAALALQPGAIESSFLEMGKRLGIPLDQLKRVGDSPEFIKAVQEGRLKQAPNMPPGFMSIDGKPFERPDFNKLMQGIPPNIQGQARTAQAGGAPAQQPGPPTRPIGTGGTGDVFQSPNIPVRTAYQPGQTFGNQATRDAKPFSGIVLHHTATKDLDSALAISRGDPSRGGGKFGYHFYIDRDGSVIQGAPLSARTNHTLPGQGFDNTNSVGISMVGNSADATPQQIASAEKLTRELSGQLGIGLDRVKGHGEIRGEKQADEGLPVLNALRGTTGGGPGSASGGPAGAAQPAGGVPTMQQIEAALAQAPAPIRQAFMAMASKVPGGLQGMLGQLNGMVQGMQGGGQGQGGPGGGLGGLVGGIAKAAGGAMAGGGGGAPAGAPGGVPPGAPNTPGNPVPSQTNAGAPLFQPVALGGGGGAPGAPPAGPVAPPVPLPEPAAAAEPLPAPTPQPEVQQAMPRRPDGGVQVASADPNFVPQAVAQAGPAPQQRADLRIEPRPQGEGAVVGSEPMQPVIDRNAEAPISVRTQSAPGQRNAPKPAATASIPTNPQPQGPTVPIAAPAAAPQPQGPAPSAAAVPPPVAAAASRMGISGEALSQMSPNMLMAMAAAARTGDAGMVSAIAQAANVYGAGSQKNVQTIAGPDGTIYERQGNQWVPVIGGAAGGGETIVNPTDKEARARLNIRPDDNRSYTVKTDKNGRVTDVSPISSEPAKDDKTFIQEQQLSKDVEANPEYKRYQAANQSLNELYGTFQQGTTTGDLGSIFKFMKALDPQSTVAAGEQASARDTGGLYGKLWAQYNSWFNKEGRITPEQRANFFNTARAALLGAKPAAERAAEQVRGKATRYKLNPDNVVIFDGKVLDPAIGKDDPATGKKATFPTVAEPPSEGGGGGGSLRPALVDLPSHAAAKKRANATKQTVRYRVPGDDREYEEDPD